MDALLTYDWPGNVRELRTAIEHGVVMATGTKLHCAICRSRCAGSNGKIARRVSATEAFGEKTSPLDLHETEKKLIAQALAATNGNVDRRSEKARH